MRGVPASTLSFVFGALEVIPEEEARRVIMAKEGRETHGQQIQPGNGVFEDAEQFASGIFDSSTLGWQF